MTDITTIGTDANKNTTINVTSWRDQIEIHPAANLFPLMSETDPKGLQAMADSIAKNPMQVPDLMPVIHAELLNPDYSSYSQMKWKFTLLDGRNRLDAMEHAGIKFALQPNPKSLPSTPGWLLDVDRGDLVVSHPLEVETGDPWKYVRRANVERRMLSRAEKRELIRRLLKMVPEKSDRAIARMVKGHKNTVKSIRAEEEARGQIAHVKTRVDTKGRKSPATKKTKHEDDRSDAAPGTTGERAAGEHDRSDAAPGPKKPSKRSKKDKPPEPPKAAETLATHWQRTPAGLGELLTTAGLEVILAAMSPDLNAQLQSRAKQPANLILKLRELNNVDAAQALLGAFGARLDAIVATVRALREPKGRDKGKSDDLSIPDFLKRQVANHG